MIPRRLISLSKMSATRVNSPIGILRSPISYKFLIFFSPLDILTELNGLIEQYFKGDEQILPSIMEAILKRGLSKKHEETDDELMDELRMAPLEDVKDAEFESDFEELHETDEEIVDLYNAREYVEKKLMKDEFFNMDDRKWDEMIKEATEQGFLKDTRECEQILEDMLSWDKLLPGNY
ncbi:hypothetical protein MA16_Dca023388 [Dendrobium catenatum]|uniref:Uncharacterized protein n=2 Tax=Dendrobium catenatum TaxID=906689 RepID=A0A2I0WVG6_9ASPA|nr:hypothetical protein MA16_Dca023388 [Dendrobium catenatum]